MKKKKVAIIGTNGIPAKYGGFETLADNLTKNLNSKFDFIVYCSRFKYSFRPKYYNNSKLIYIPLKANGWQSIIYDLICQIHALFIVDVSLILGPSAGIFLFINKLTKRRTIVNHGGLDEWNRTKYNFFERKYSRFNHWLSAKCADVNIADNNSLSVSLYDNFHVQSKNIAYGGDHVYSVFPQKMDYIKYPFLKLKYALSVSRAQIDNNIHLLIKAFKELPDKILVIVANWEATQYGIDLKEKYCNLKIPNIYLLDAIYNLKELNLLRSNATIYIHSHSQCGTAPSLVEAICLKLPIISYDVATNRETTENKALYFKDSHDLIDLIHGLDNKICVSLKQDMEQLATKKYTWKTIAQQYAELF